MAILQSRTQTGISWVKESVALFKTAPRKWLSVALVYVGLFMMLPSIPGLQFFAFISILIWPVFLAIAISLYRNAEMKKQQNVNEIITQIQPKIAQLVGLGGACLLYAVLVSFVLNSDLQGLEALVGNKDKMTESQMMAFLQTMFPLLLKLTLLLIPLMMATWFAPMLIAFNNYNLVKAIKSSIAGSLQYIVALGAAWICADCRHPCLDVGRWRCSRDYQCIGANAGANADVIYRVWLLITGYRADAGFSIC